MKNLNFFLIIVALTFVGCGYKSISDYGLDILDVEVLCDNEIDDDGDGFIDCDDTDCATSSHCTGGDPEVLCDDDIDNDGDGAVDCKDTDCASAENCAVPQENCVNGIDDDRDGLVDCADPDCASHTSCNEVGPEEVCDDGLDNDRDGKIDCADADCAEASNCLPSVEVCTDGVDNDQDGFVDCADVDCAQDSHCVEPEPVCGNGVIEGEEQCDGSNFGGATCLSKGFDGGSLTCTACIIRTVNCTENPICGDGICEGSETEDTCSFDCELGVENCSNGQDDDGDGWIDCDDADCWSQAACQLPYCGDGICNGSDTQANCPADCGTPITCGNGVLNAGEDCDGSNLNGRTCVSLGYTGGTLSCNSACDFNVSACTSAVVENCYDGLDNDGDNLVDWHDPNCVGSIPAGKNPELYCSNGYDDNSNGYYDTRDHSCSSFGRVGTGTSFFTCIPKQGTVDYGCVCSDAPTTWVTTTSGQKTTTTGKACVGNSHPTGTTSWEVGWIGSSCTVDNILAHMDLDGYRDFSAIQFMYVSRTAGTASNMAIVVGCSIVPGTNDQLQGNMGVMENPNDSAQRAFMDNIFPNNQWRVIYVGSSAISRLTWYEAYFSPR